MQHIIFNIAFASHIFPLRHSKLYSGTAKLVISDLKDSLRACLGLALWRVYDWADRLEKFDLPQFVYAKRLSSTQHSGQTSKQRLDC